jgi:hexulose-6-phosphate isomerase
MNRREHRFATLAGLAVNAAAVLGQTANSQPARRRNFKKGYMLNTFPRRELPLLEKFKIIREAGFEGVEPPSHLDPDEILRARDQTGLLIPSVTCGQQSRPLSSADPAKRAAAVEGIKEALRRAKRYGASSILVVPGGVTAEISYQQAYQRNQQELRKIVPLAEELGVKLALENVWNNFLLSPLEAARFVDEFNSAAAGWYFDVGNVIYLGWPEQWIRILSHRIQKVHIKEYSRQRMKEGGLRAGFGIEFLAGDNDWPAVMKAFDEIGYQGWAIAEPAWRPANVEPANRLQQIAQKMEAIFAS